MKKLLLILFCSVVFALPVFAQKSVVVVSIQANVRETPSAQSKVVGKVSKGNILSESATKEDWPYITFGNIRGWVHNSTIEVPVVKERPPGKFVINTDLIERNFRDAYVNEWIKLHDDDKEIKYYNPSTMIRKGNLVKIWTKSVNLNDFSYSILYIGFDCLTREMIILEIADYDSNKSLIKNKDYRKIAKFDSVIPDSIGENLLEKTCRLSK